MSKEAYSHYLLEVKQEYTRQLTSLLVPVMYEGLHSIFIEAKKNSKNESPMKVFQILLSRIPQWNQTIISNEYQRIILKTQCDWINDLITAVYMSNAKILSSLKTKKKIKTLNLQVPEGDFFIHNAYIECARQFWKNPYLFYDDIPTIEYQRNMREAEIMIEQCINETIRKLLPVRSILQQYIALDAKESSTSSSSSSTSSSSSSSSSSDSSSTKRKSSRKKKSKKHKKSKYNKHYNKVNSDNKLEENNNNEKDIKKIKKKNNKINIETIKPVHKEFISFPKDSEEDNIIENIVNYKQKNLDEENGSLQYDTKTVKIDLQNSFIKPNSQSFSNISNHNDFDSAIINKSNDISFKEPININFDMKEPPPSYLFGEKTDQLNNNIDYLQKNKTDKELSIPENLSLDFNPVQPSNNPVVIPENLSLDFNPVQPSNSDNIEIKIEDLNSKENVKQVYISNATIDKDQQPFLKKRPDFKKNN